MDTPVPIPNTEVKHLYADGSKLNLARVGSRQANSLIMPAQLSWLEHLTVNQGVVGSSPTTGAISFYSQVQTYGPLVKRLTHMPFTHAFMGSNPVRVTICYTRPNLLEFIVLMDHLYWMLTYNIEESSYLGDFFILYIIVTML